MKDKKVWLKWLSLTLTIGIMAIVMVYLNIGPSGEAATAASKVIFEKAVVEEVLVDDASPDAWTEGLRLGTQQVILKVYTGDHQDKVFTAVNYLNAYANVDLSVGDKVIVRMDYDAYGMPFIVSIVNYNRLTMIVILCLLYMGALIVIGGKKGAYAIIGLLFTLFSIWFFLIPLLRRGAPAIPSAIALVVVTTFVSLVALNGFSRKTFVAVVGCVGGVTIAGLIAHLAGVITPISGFNMSEAEELVLRASDSGLTIKGLLVSGVLIASLGAVMDVALSIASAISELKDMNDKADKKMLFKSGMNIGKDAMGTMANTLILAFAGASLNLLILFRVFDYPYLQIFNSDLMAIEIIQGLAGSIGIVLTVPLVAALGAVLFGSKSLMKNAR